MGKRGGGKRRVSDGDPTTSSGLHTSLSLREEANGKKQSHHNAKSILKLKHLQHLAEWSTAEASIPSLGALLGHRFAEFGEALGISPDYSLFPCQRCETILQPGLNCSVRIEKNRAKRRRRSKTYTPTKNNVVYTCHFCSHRNLKRGTPKGYIRDKAPSKAKPSLKPFKGGDSTVQKCEDAEKSDVNKVASYVAIETRSPLISHTCSSISLTDAPPTPLAMTGAKLLDSKRRKRKKPGPKESADESLIRSSAKAEPEKGSGTTSRKRRKSWTSLKEIAATEENERNQIQRLKDFSIPFLL